MLDRDREELYATILGIRPPWHVTAENAVRKQENRELTAAGEYAPKGTKYVWTQNPERSTFTSAASISTPDRAQLPAQLPEAPKKCAFLSPTNPDPEASGLGTSGFGMTPSMHSSTNG